jgi:hypothetical protein
MIKVMTVVQQIMTDLSEGVSEKEKLMIFSKMVLILLKMAARIHRSLKIFTINAKRIGGHAMSSVNRYKAYL